MLLCREKLFTKIGNLEKNTSKQEEVTHKENDASSEGKFTQQLKKLETNLSNLIADNQGVTRTIKGQDAQEQVIDKLTKLEERLFEKIYIFVSNQKRTRRKIRTT